MSDTPTLREVRLTFDPPASVLPDEGIDARTVSQLYRGTRTTVEPRTVEVNYWLSPSRLEFYVIVSGAKVRQRDGALSRTRGRLVYWPEGHDAQPETRIESAPTWVQDIVAEAHRLTGGLA